MPSTIAELFKAAGLSRDGVVKWGEPVRENRCGVYVVALTDDPEHCAGCLSTCPSSIPAIQNWLSVRAAEFRLDGASGPQAADVAKRLSEFWLSDETVLYIGRTGRPLSKRIGEYYETPLGAKRPHAGGHWIQALANRDNLYLHYATTADPDAAEIAMFRSFCANVSKQALSKLRDPEHPYPFANLEWPNCGSESSRGRKIHGMAGQREP